MSLSLSSLLCSYFESLFFFSNDDWWIRSQLCVKCTEQQNNNIQASSATDILFCQFHCLHCLKWIPWSSKSIDLFTTWRDITEDGNFLILGLVHNEFTGSAITRHTHEWTAWNISITWLGCLTPCLSFFQRKHLLKVFFKKGSSKITLNYSFTVNQRVFKTQSWKHATAHLHTLLYCNYHMLSWQVPAWKEHFDVFRLDGIFKHKVSTTIRM